MNKVASIKGLDNKLNLLNVIRAVLILASKNKVAGQLDDEAVLAAVEDDRLLEQIQNLNLDEVEPWQVAKAKKFTDAPNWTVYCFMIKSECVGHLSLWVETIIQIKHHLIDRPQKRANGGNTISPNN